MLTADQIEDIFQKIEDEPYDSDAFSKLDGKLNSDSMLCGLLKLQEIMIREGGKDSVIGGADHDIIYLGEIKPCHEDEDYHEYFNITEDELRYLYACGINYSSDNSGFYSFV